MSSIFRVIPAFWLALWLAVLPLSAVAQQDLTGTARYEPDRSSLVDLRDGVRLRLGLSQGVPYRVFTLTGPDRLVIDFREVDWQGARPGDLDRSAKIRELRFGAFRAGWSRLVAALDTPMAVETAGVALDASDGRALLEVVLRRTSPEDFAARAGAPRDPRWDLPAAAPVQADSRRADPNRPLVVVLDPGHGGIDPGAQAGGFDEADLMLAMARELQEVLLRAGGFEVHLTRDADVFVSLEGRVAIAHDRRADLFVSLHADALEEGRARGAAVYTLAAEASDAASAALAERHNRDDLLAGLDLSSADDRVANVLMDIARLDNGPRSTALARHLVEGIRNATGRVHKRPLRQAGFSVLKAADIPSVLVEVGFLSTQEELKNLSDPLWRAGMAAGLRDGIQAWALEDAALAGLRRQ